MNAKYFDKSSHISTPLRQDEYKKKPPHNYSTRKRVGKNLTFSVRETGVSQGILGDQIRVPLNPSIR